MVKNRNPGQLRSPFIAKRKHKDVELSFTIDNTLLYNLNDVTERNCITQALQKAKIPNISEQLPIYLFSDKGETSVREQCLC